MKDTLQQLGTLLTKQQRILYTIDVERRNFEFLGRMGFANTPGKKLEASGARLEVRQTALDKVNAELRTARYEAASGKKP